MPDEYLNRLLGSRKLLDRVLQRSKLPSRFKPAPKIWGGTHETVAIWYGVTLLSFPWLMLIAGLLFERYRLAEPATFGRFWLMLPLILVWLPAYAYIRRPVAIWLRNPTESAVFVAAIGNIAPEVPENFVLAARRALASGYCVSSNMIAASDSRRRTKAFFMLRSPYAVEVIAEIMHDLGVNFDAEKIISTAKTFKTCEASTVAELVALLHKRMF